MRCPVSNNGQPHLSRKTPWPYVNPYHFHIIDPDWGHITIKMSGHPPFGIQVMLNGHEWVERKAIKQTISLEKEGNCFVGGSFQALDQPSYDLTVFKLHFGPMTLKIYDKGPRVLRIEAIVHNAKGLRFPGESIRMVENIERGEVQGEDKSGRAGMGREDIVGRSAGFKYLFPRSHTSAWEWISYFRFPRGSVGTSVMVMDLTIR